MTMKYSKLIFAASVLALGACSSEVKTLLEIALIKQGLGPTSTVKKQDAEKEKVYPEDTASKGTDTKRRQKSRSTKLLDQNVFL